MPDLTLAEMAREIERRRKGSLPKSLRAEDVSLWTDCAFDGVLSIMLEAELSRAILRDAMVMATGARRLGGKWTLTFDVTCLGGGAFQLQQYCDSDHGNCPTRSLFAAFLAVFPEPTP